MHVLTLRNCICQAHKHTQIYCIAKLLTNLSRTCYIAPFSNPKGGDVVTKRGTIQFLGGFQSLKKDYLFNYLELIPHSFYLSRSNGRSYQSTFDTFRHMDMESKCVHGLTPMYEFWMLKRDKGKARRLTDSNAILMCRR